MWFLRKTKINIYSSRYKKLYFCKPPGEWFNYTLFSNQKNNYEMQMWLWTTSWLAAFLLKGLQKLLNALNQPY